MSKYAVEQQGTSYRVFLPDRRNPGRTFPIRVANHVVTLTHASGVTVEFKRYLHRGVWRWKDGRDGKQIDESYVVSELTRMLKNAEAALAIVAEARS